MLHVLRLERGYDGCARSARGGGAGDYRRLPSLTLGVLGLGDIGSTIANAASAGFGMQVVGCRRDKSPRASDGAVARVFGLDELPAFLASADYLVSVLPSTPDTRGLLDGDVLAACAGARRVISVSGDPEATIVAALDAGRLSHTSVTCSRQSRSGSPLWSHPKVTVTPHNSAVTKARTSLFAKNLELEPVSVVGGIQCS